MTDKALSVSQLNNYIKSLIESDDVLNYVTVRAEISNFKHHSSGHLYFTLKDDKSEIAAVMFRASASRLTFAPKNGDKVIAYGKISVYEVAGKYQVYVSAMTDDGAGALYAEYQRLLAQLRSEGLFDASRKKPIPAFPKRVGIVTSPTGAAIRDMINVTGRRYPLAELVICPSAVQGADAPAELLHSLMLLDAVGECDVIIIGRGGGSAEDLWAFNNEALVRAVAAAKTPIISAVGHETDTTLCDFAADLRAPTPSAAAELAVPDREALMQKTDERSDRMNVLMERRISAYRASLDTSAKQLALSSPTARLLAARERIKVAGERIERGALLVLDKKKMLLASSIGRLEAINPLAVLGRGYSIAHTDSGAVVCSASQVESGDVLCLRVSDGSIDAVVTGKRGN
jgi:exodeoxyribonuclease VII large subunit